MSHTNKGLKLLQQNIRSLKRNMAGLSPLVVRSGVSWDCIVLTECWLPSNPNIPHLSGYSHSATTKNHTQNEGVVVYHRSDLIMAIKEPELAEANCLVMIPDKHTVVLAIYRPPGYKNVNNFIQSLNNLLIKYSSVQNVIVLGDINIDICESSSDPNSSPYLDMLAFHGLLPAHTLPTHNKTCLDHILLKTKSPACSLVLQTSLTDHNSVALAIDTRLVHKPAKIINKINHSSLSEDIKAVDFSHLYRLEDANEATNYFIETVQTLIKLNTKKIRTSARKRVLKPWITSGILKCLKNRDNLYKKTKLDPNNVILKTTYKRYRNFCSTLLKKLKQEHEKLQLQSANNNNKKLWKAIKEITYTVKPKDTPFELINTQNPSISINSVNNYFANVGKILAEKINKTNIHAPPKISKSCPNSFALLPVDEDEINKLIVNLKSDCAIGLDMISAEILKSNKDILKTPITYICNLSFSTGVFPIALKKSRIFPIHKSGDRDCVDNYRPISILSTLSKILERALNKRVVKYFEDNKLLSAAQFGFRSKKSTSDAVQELTNYIVTNLDRKKKTIGVFLDLAKAFDTVSIPILLNKLESMGIRDLQLKLFESYLTERTQCVKIENHTSEHVAVHFGVPQGSILGPTMFLAYINDLCQLDLINAKIITFADDTALLFSGETWGEVFSYAQSGFNIVTEWLNENILTLNVDKTKYITFSLRNQDSDIAQYKLISHICSNYHASSCMCSRLERTNKIKYLGIVIDSKLSFHDHINLLAARTRKLIYIFKNLRHIASKELIKSVYLALAQSQLSYCILAWGGITKTHLLKIERAQRAVLKVSLSLPFFHPTTEVYKQSKVLTVRQLFILHTVIKQHSLLVYEPKSIEKRRRKDMVCTKPLFKTGFAHRFFCYQGCHLYNKLNRVLSIYSLTKNKCKAVVRDWLQTLEYSSTENLLR